MSLIERLQKERLATQTQSHKLDTVIRLCKEGKKHFIGAEFNQGNHYEAVEIPAALADDFDALLKRLSTYYYNRQNEIETRLEHVNDLLADLDKSRGKLS